MEGNTRIGVTEMKKIEMKKEYKYYLMLGAAIFVVGIVLVDSSLASTLRLIGIVLIGLGVVRHKVYGAGPEEDERTRKMEAFALSCSWIVTMVFVGAVLLLVHEDILEMSSELALGLTMIVMVGAAIVSEWYVKRKGDIK